MTTRQTTGQTTGQEDAAETALFARMDAAMETLECPHCAASDLEMVEIAAPGEPPECALFCPLCGLTAPVAASPDEAAALWGRIRMDEQEGGNVPRSTSNIQHSMGGDAPVQVGLEIGTAKILLSVLAAAQASLGQLCGQRAAEQHMELLQLGIDAIQGAVPQVCIHDQVEESHEGEDVMADEVCSECGGRIFDSHNCERCGRQLCGECVCDCDCECEGRTCASCQWCVDGICTHVLGAHQADAVDARDAACIQYAAADGEG